MSVTVIRVFLVRDLCTTPKVELNKASELTSGKFNNQILKFCKDIFLVLITLKGLLSSKTWLRSTLG